jgi:sec-independent protein translocase protein TatC
LVIGVILSSPWVFYQIWSFVAAGLYPHEKKLVNYYMPISIGLFLTGALVSQVDSAAVV